MNTRTLFTISLLATAGVGCLWQTVRLEQAQSANLELCAQNARLSKLDQELDRLRSSAAEPAEPGRLRDSERALKQDVERLQKDLAAARMTAARTEASAARPSASPGPDAGSTNASVRGALDRLKAATDLGFEAQMARARERLNLSSSQEQNLRAIVEKALNDGRDNLQKVLSGQARPEDVPTREQWVQDLERQILSELTPEQQTAYQKYKREDISAAARLTANGELLLVQSTLGLSQEQQDQMFAVLYTHAVSQSDPDAASAPLRPSEPLAALEWQAAQKLRSLESVLTPPQLETYRQMQDAQLQYFKSIFPRTTPNPQR